jgi:hypothetical protein
MKTISLLQPPSKKFIELALKKYGLNLENIKGQSHPQEDFLLVSEKYPIFVVADGVTLIQYLIEKREYPVPSPAGEIAHVFCEALVKAAKAKYVTFQESDTQEISRIANEAAGEYNREQGRTKETVDYWDNDFYAATAAFAVVKDHVVYWGSIGDSYVIHLTNKGELILKSPGLTDRAEVGEPKFTGDVSDRKESVRHVWSKVRNGVNADGKLNGYGVVTGEESANRYLNFGSFKAGEGDIVAVLTDGFENYFQLPEFINLLNKWPDDLESRLREFIAAKEKEDPAKFGYERSLIAISI